MGAPPGVHTAIPSLASNRLVHLLAPAGGRPALDEGGAPQLFWHETPTTDFNIVLEGSLVLRYDGGEVALGAGDTVVVHGGRHAWSNPSSMRALLAAVAVADPA